jgi:putative FmdB family regulatory protein
VAIGSQVSLGNPVLGEFIRLGKVVEVPTYQYRCENCGKTFERTETISEHEALKPPCPKCGSKKVSFVPGRVYVVTTKKS